MRSTVLVGVALARTELQIKCERITDTVFTRHAAGKDLGGRLQAFTDRCVRIAVRLIDAGEPAAQVARDMGMSSVTLYRCLEDIPTVKAATAISR
jgi:DNA invertase Pin-like site-specific DNA recombinase